MKLTSLLLAALLFIAVFTQSQFHSTPTLEELKALRSIRGKIQGTIVWATSRHGTWEIYKMKADGTEKIRLTNDQEVNDHPVWSKDGKWIYYQRNSDIYRMYPDGSNSQIVVTNGFSFDISDDGLKLVYVKEEFNRCSIMLRDLEKEITGEIVPARVPEFEGKSLRFPTLSPDNNWLAFSSNYPTPWNIQIVRLNGKDRYQYAYGCMPQCRYDGQWLTWISRYHEVYIGTPDGEEQRPFENSIPGRPHCYFPRWSSDGEYIVFAASPHSNRDTGDYEIYIKPIDGNDSVRLTFHSATDRWPDLFIPEETKPVKRKKAIR